MNLAQELQNKLGEHNPADVDELILDDLFEGVEHFDDQDKKALEKYDSLLHLSLNGFGLKSFRNFPKIDSLQILEVSNNNLEGGDLSTVKELYPNLYKLKIGSNPVKDLNAFKVFEKGVLRKLDVSDTPVAGGKSYREKLFKLIKTLEVIDHKNKEGDEIDSTIYEDEEGEDDNGEEFDEASDEEEEDYEEDDEDDEKS